LHRRESPKRKADAKTLARAPIALTQDERRDIDSAAAWMLKAS